MVLGGANTDYLVRGEQLPGDGRSVEGDLFLTGPGGKALNQAVAASRLAALAVCLARGRSLGESSRFAVAASALATTAIGAQAAMPSAGAVERLLAEQ